MILEQNCSKTANSFATYNDIPISDTNEYNFLGMLIKNNGNLSHSTIDLKKKALR